MSPSSLELYHRALAYSQKRGLIVNDKLTLGSGVHGTVFICRRKRATTRTALKVHEQPEAYVRERDVYQRLSDLQIDQIEGHHIPQLVDFDDEFLAIEMSVVVRPFVLDFGGAYLDQAPDFSAEILEQWEQDKEEQFEDNWPKAKAVLAALGRYGIYVVDVNPGNIGFFQG